MSILELVDKKYLGYSEENIESYNIEDFDYGLGFNKKNKKRRTKSKVDLAEIKKRMLLYLVNLILDENIMIADKLGLQEDEYELLNLLDNYSLMELFYIRRALKEYIELGELTEEDFFSMNIEIDTNNQVQGQLILKFF